MSHGHLDVVLLARGHHGIGLGERRSEGFLAEDAPRSGLRRSDGHSRMTAHHARANIDQIEVLSIQHIAIVCIRARGPRALSSCDQPLVVGIGHGDYVHFGHITIDHIQPVSIVALSGVANQHGLILFSHFFSLSQDR